MIIAWSVHVPFKNGKTKQKSMTHGNIYIEHVHSLFYGANIKC